MSMSASPRDRIMGVETEFGCFVVPEFGRPEGAVEAIKNHVFLDARMGVLDRHARDEVFEPAESGGFLRNGGRLYIDAVGSHLEYATAECRTLRDLIAQDRAGQRMIVQAMRDMGIDEVVDVYSNSVDHFGGHTFGCHENYLVKMDEDFFSSQAPQLYPFLVTRQIFAGVGRVGGHELVEGGPPAYEELAANPIDYIWVSNVYRVHPDPTVTYQISQRADHILRTMASRVRFNRAMINPKWETFYANEGRHRLHVLFGEANQSRYAYALKVGTTHLVLRLLEEGVLKGRPRLLHPIHALQDISRDPTYKWMVDCEHGSMSAVEIQREHLEWAQRYQGESEETDWVLREWERTLDDLSLDPMRTADRLDWTAKKMMLARYLEDTGGEWSDDALHSIDLEYHNIDPEKSLFHALGLQGFGDDLDDLDAMTIPPTNTRAHGRGKLVKHLLDGPRRRAAIIDWSGAAVGRDTYLDFSDPFEPGDDVLSQLEPSAPAE